MWLAGLGPGHARDLHHTTTTSTVPLICHAGLVFFVIQVRLRERQPQPIEFVRLSIPLVERTTSAHRLHRTTCCSTTRQCVMPVAPEIYRVMDMSIDAYDTNPLPLCEILRLDPGADDEERTMQRSQKMTRSKGIAPPNKQVKWEKKDVVTKGLYKPWFFTRFARLWIPLGKPQCAMDLKSISSAASTQARRRPKKSHHTDDSSETSVLEEVWVGCDGCSKWRKVPRGFQFDKNKSFFCHMLTDTTCETPEEEWDDEEEFVDDDNVDLIVDGAHYGSISTTPRSAHSDSSQRENSTRAHSSHEHGKSPRDYSHPRDVTNNSAGMRAAGKRRLISPRVYGADDDDGIASRLTFPCFLRNHHPWDSTDTVRGGAVETDSFPTTKCFSLLDAFPLTTKIVDMHVSACTRWCLTDGRAASGGALAPEPPRVTRVTSVFGAQFFDLLSKSAPMKEKKFMTAHLLKKEAHDGAPF